MTSMICLTRIPYASLIAFILTLIGIGLFCGTMWEAVSITLIQMETSFHIKLTALDHIRTAFIVVASTMGTISVLLLILGFLTTGATRVTIYKGHKSRISGRISLIFFMIVTYVLTLIWFFILCSMSILCFILGVLLSNCYVNRMRLMQNQNLALPSQSRSPDFLNMNNLNSNSNNPLFMSNHANPTQATCLNLDNYKFFMGGKYDTRYNIPCGQSFVQFCNYTQNSLSLYIVATIAALFVVLGLIHFLMCLAANYAHIKNYKRIMEYEEAKFMEEREMSMIKSRF